MCPQNHYLFRKNQRKTAEELIAMTRKLPGGAPIAQAIRFFMLSWMLSMGCGD